MCDRCFEKLKLVSMFGKEEELVSKAFSEQEELVIK
jgi:hypothetical protein